MKRLISHRFYRGRQLDFGCLFLASLFVIGVLTGAPSAQVVNTNIIHIFRGDGAYDFFGRSVSNAGDVNGDGYADSIAGGIGAGSGGIAKVFSGQDGSILYTFHGDSAGDGFGQSVSGAGDVNKDGFADLIVGADGADNNGSGSGSARVFSGKDGSVLYTFNGDSAGDYFGYSVAGAGDVNRDGFADLIVGAYRDDSNVYESGSARVFSGKDGSILYTFNGDMYRDHFGYSVAGAGDVNGDGFADLIVGASRDMYRPGSARVFSGKDGSVLYTFNGDSAGDLFGSSVAGPGDVNGDGFADLIVGAHWDDNNGSNAGSARVFSGKDGSVLYTFNGDSAGDSFGSSVAGAGDVNHDGWPDLIVGAPYDDDTFTDAGSARVFSGRDGSILFTCYGESDSDFFGVAVSSAGDVNRDCRDDILVGASWNDANGARSGSAYVFSGDPGPVAPGPCPSSGGDVLFTLYGPPGSKGFGMNVSHAGDVNGDGLGDLLVMASAYAYVFSGQDQALLYTLTPTTWGRGTRACSGAGDVNRDGFDDIVLGYFASNKGLGEVNIFSGKDGSLIRHHPGSGGNFGSAANAAGDVNNDGFADIIVGAPYDSSSGKGAGRVFVFSGMDGMTLHDIKGSSTAESLGWSVSGAGDVNGDGYADFIAGAIGAGSGGIAKVFSGQDGTVLHTLTTPSSLWTGFGYDVSGAGDVNDDGFDDVIVGAPYSRINGYSSGSVAVFSGQDGSILYEFHGDSTYDYFGWSVRGAGDVDGDGRPDLIVGAYGDDNNGSISGSARVFSGKDGSILVTYDGDSTGHRFGESVSGAGDVNGDGLADLVVGATQGGYARVFTVRTADPDLSTVAVNPSATVLGGVAEITVVPRVAGGELLGSGHDVVITTTLGTLLGSVEDHCDGSYPQRIQGTALGTALISATVDSVTLNSGATLTVFDPENFGKVVGVDGQSTPFGYASIQMAVDDVQARNLNAILIAPGSYDEVVFVKNATGLVIQPGSLEGTVTLRGIRMAKCANLSLQRLVIDAAGTGRPGIDLLPGAGNENRSIFVAGCEIRNTGTGAAGICVGNFASGVQIANCRIENCGGDGIHLKGAGGLHLIHACEIWSNQWNGIRIDRDQAGVTISVCCIKENGKKGHKSRSYGIFRERASGPYDPTDVTLELNVLKINHGVLVPSRSDKNVGNYDQIIDTTDEQYGYTP